MFACCDRWAILRSINAHNNNICALFLHLQQGQLVAMGDRNRTLRIYDIARLKPDDEASLESCCVLDQMNAHEVGISNVSFNYRLHVLIWFLFRVDRLGLITWLLVKKFDS